MNDTSMLDTPSDHPYGVWHTACRAVILTAIFLSLLFGAYGTSLAQADSPQRKDNVFGTVDEGMTSGTDPYSGDNTMRVQPPPPQPQDEQNSTYGNIPIIVAPEIRIKPKKKK